MQLRTITLSLLSVFISTSLFSRSYAATLDLIPLRTVVDDDITGLQREPVDVVVKLRDSARKYTQFKRGTLSKNDTESWIRLCEKDSKSDDFCPLVLGKEPPETEPEDTEIREEDEKSSAQVSNSKDVAQWMKNGDFSSLKQAQSSAIYRALRTIKKWDELDLITQKTIKESSNENCKNPSIATALAQKAEMYLPDAKYLKVAYQLYEKVISCSKDRKEESADRSRFRYALLKVSEGDCKSAEVYLDKLYEESNEDYGSRALYWRAHCAKVQGNNPKFSKLQQKLLKEYPLSYHSLVLNRAHISRITRVLAVGEPNIRFRSLKEPLMNSWIRAAEALESIRADDYARRVMSRVLESIENLEPEFRLYAAVLANRAGDPITQFKLLSSIFKEQPDLISQNTLKLFYPLKNVTAIRKYANSLDPFFVAALIRQESGFNPWAQSRVGAVGLMQLMPRTARSMEKVSKRSLFDPNTNIRLGTRYISKLVKKYNHDAELALAAYNAGGDRVDEWKKRYTTKDRMLFIDLIPYKETRDYVVLISRNYFWYNNLYGNSFGVPSRSIARSESNSKSLIFTLFK